MKKLILFSALVLLALGERLWWDMGWNVELVTVTTLIAAIYLGKKWSFGLVLAVMGISDLVLGDTNIWLFTWSAFLVEAVFARRVWFGIGTAMGASVWFYLWTNFGVWLLDSWGMYSHDLNGLVQSYINGLPFLKANLLSNMIIVPVGFLFVAKGGWLWWKIWNWLRDGLPKAVWMYR